MPPRRAPPFSIIREPNTAPASPRDKRGEQVRQFLRRILAVAMDQGDEVEAVVDSVPVAELLVAAVALVDRGAQDGDLEALDGLLMRHAGGESVVLRRIVDDENLDVTAAQFLRGCGAGRCRWSFPRCRQR